MKQLKEDLENRKGTIFHFSTIFQNFLYIHTTLKYSIFHDSPKKNIPRYFMCNLKKLENMHRRDSDK